MIGSIARRGLLAFAFGLVALGAAPRTTVAQALPAYSSAAGMLHIGKDPERPDAEMFHVDYILKEADPATRPVTFLFNGGPGAASIYLHMSAIGPKTVVTAGDGSFPAVPARLQENPDSWIRFTDLVFLDPIGTGYSRMLPGPDGAPRDAKPYEGVVGDLDSIAIFIRQWLTVNKRWGSPKAIAGESYGGQRVAALSRILAEQYAINLNRAILLSPAFYLDLAEPHYSLVAPMTLLPTQAAIAAYHGLNKLGDDPAALKAVEDYAQTDYLTGLATLGHASAAQRAAFFAKVGGLIGLDPAFVERHNGRVSESVYAVNLLASRGQVIDTYDGTQVSDNPNPDQGDMVLLDRSLTVLGGVLLAPFMDYLRNDLQYVSDRPYIVLDLNLNRRWDRSAPLGGPDDLAIALAQNHDLKALVVHGYHDMVSNYMMSRYVLEQATRSRGARERLYFGTYPGGHMFYLRTKSRAEMAADVRGFFEGKP
ncbi:MAG: septum formation initiator [Dongiaceae bacterium]